MEETPSMQVFMNLVSNLPPDVLIEVRDALDAYIFMWQTNNVLETPDCEADAVNPEDEEFVEMAVKRHAGELRN